LKTNKKEKADIGLSAFLSQKGHKDGLKKALYLRKNKESCLNFWVLHSMIGKIREMEELL
jgi:hypothetical protein